MIIIDAVVDTAADDDDDVVVQVKCSKAMNVHCNMIAMNRDDSTTDFHNL